MSIRMRPSSRMCGIEPSRTRLRIALGLSPVWREACCTVTHDQRNADARSTSASTISFTNGRRSSLRGSSSTRLRLPLPPALSSIAGVLLDLLAARPFEAPEGEHLLAQRLLLAVAVQDAAVIFEELGHHGVLAVVEKQHG